MKRVAIVRFGMTAVLVLIAAVLAWLLWHHYMYSPWTRDARVRAKVVAVAPDVSGLITDVAVHDNQLVHQGDVLFRIDAARFRNAVQQAQADLDAARAQAKSAGASLKATDAAAAAARATYAMRHSEATRRKHMTGAVSKEAQSDAAARASAAHAQWQAAQASQGKAGAAKAQALAAVEQAQAALALANLDLRRATVRAPRDGYVTNLDLYVGDYARAGQSSLALVGMHSFWVYGYFEETKLAGVRVGDPVAIRLMDGTRFQGTVASIARGIADRDNAVRPGQLAHVKPTFNWVRLAQRIPAHIAIDRASLPQGTRLVAGMTATVTLHPGRRHDKPPATHSD